MTPDEIRKLAAEIGRGDVMAPCKENKEFCLSVLQFLAALEGWTFGAGKSMPDYLQEQLGDIVADLTNEVIGK